MTYVISVDNVDNLWISRISEGVRGVSGIVNTFVRKKGSECGSVTAPAFLEKCEQAFGRKYPHKMTYDVHRTKDLPVVGHEKCEQTFVPFPTSRSDQSELSVN